MAIIYQLKVKLDCFDNFIWRDMEFPSTYTLDKVVYAIIVAFEGKGKHDYILNHKDRAFVNNIKGAVNKNVLLSKDVKLKDLALDLNDPLYFEYDLQSQWQFTIEYLGAKEIPNGLSKNYPKVIQGKGKGIIEDFDCGSFGEVILEIRRSRKVAHVLTNNYEELDWDYRDFDVLACDLKVRRTYLKLKRNYQ